MLNNLEQIYVCLMQLMFEYSIYMKPETACEKIMNEIFVQIINLLNNSERTVNQWGD